ncbi:DUF4013 domain-containing protein [Synoicihabitans lomoniglobus]|uniref:DUF4013 domain-containing protein n=1 Tax=Synoicihabitans lomoniglobus TaxID=2909285 RepID=A0AAF0CQG1_9BACT|nr:DUF4013 domain-containing protein [Opitutaceae bacterium LMO-M01]WED66191.1 DUF4013 domain-containing protein [Opitutaceae bacterium LMO-M01]
MPTLELVCKRLFADSSWFIKCIVGALLLVVPVAHFLAFGYLYALIERSRRGDAVMLPEWGEWRRMFFDGIAAFVIFFALGVIPLAIAWLMTLPLRWLEWGAIVYLPMVPVVMLVGPLVVAGIYQYQKREEYRDAFRLVVLGSMLRSTRGRLVLPTLAFIGFLIAGYPLMTFTVFVALAASWTYYAASFRMIEEARRGGVKV